MSPAKKYRFHEDDDRLIRQRYDSRTETITELAAILRVPRWVVRRRAQELGLARCKERPWTEEEEEFLEANLSHLAVLTLARRLRRSPTAIAVKAKRLGLRKRDGAYTARAVAQGFGVDDHAVVRWIDAGMLKARRRNSGRPRDMYFISDRAVKDFVRGYPLAFDLRKVDQLWFMDLVTDGIGGTE